MAEDTSGNGAQDGSGGVYRSKPVVAWSLTAIIAGCVAAAVVLLLVDTAGPRDTALSCTAYENASTLRLTIRSQVTAAEAAAGCGTSTEGLSSAASYWVVGTPPLPEEEPRMICALSSPDEPTTVLIEEVPGFRSHGERICGSLAGEGWTADADAPDVGPGQREYLAAKADQVRDEAAEAAIREQERATEERRERRRERSLAQCEDEVRKREAAELQGVEDETRQRAQGAPEERAFEIEEEGWEREEEVWDRSAEELEACEAEGTG